MNQALLLLALLAHPDCSCSWAEARQVVEAASAAAERHAVPQDLLLAVVLSESRCSNQVAYPRPGGCDVGYAQVHLRECSGPEVGKLLGPIVNLDRAAQVLAWSRRACWGPLRRTSRCKATQWARYNWHSRTWWSQVRRRLKALRLTYRSLDATSQHLVW